MRYIVFKFLMAGIGWSSEATRALISIWGESDVQKSLDGVKRNKDIYQAVALQLQKLGYKWTWEQCRTKIKNLTQSYRKVKSIVQEVSSLVVSC